MKRRKKNLDIKEAEVDIHTANYFLHQLEDEENNCSIVSNTARYNCVVLDEIIEEMLKGLEINPFRLNNVITDLKKSILKIEQGV